MDSPFIEELLIKEVNANFDLDLTVSITSETLDETSLLAGPEKDYFEGLNIEKRKNDWLRARNALKQVLSRLGEDLDTSSISFPNPKYSLSHSSNYAIAVGLGSSYEIGQSEDKPKNILGVGVDMEVSDLSKLKTDRFFTDDEDKAWLNSLDEDIYLYELKKLWSIKEALFKADPENLEKGLRFFRPLDYEAKSGEANTGQKYLCLEIENGFLSFAYTPSS